MEAKGFFPPSFHTGFFFVLLLKGVHFFLLKEVFRRVLSFLGKMQIHFKKNLSEEYIESFKFYYGSGSELWFASLDFHERITEA